MIRFASKLPFAAVLFVAFPAAAGQADICYSPPTPLGVAAPPTNATVFACPLAGNHTLPELATLGWSVVQMMPLVVSDTSQATQLVIQKP